MSLDDLMKYETAGVAHVEQEQRPDLAVAAMQEYYKKEGYLSDPLIQKGFRECQESMREDIRLKRAPRLDSGLASAVISYSNQYEKAFYETPISELVPYLSKSYKFPERTKIGILKYGKNTILELSEKLKDKNIKPEEKKEIEDAIGALLLPKDFRLRAISLEFYERSINEQHNEMYPEEKKAA
jgi:hypothetical protein